MSSVLNYPTDNNKTASKNNSVILVFGSFSRTTNIWPMRKIIFLFLALQISGCGIVKKKTTYSNERKITVSSSEPKPKRPVKTPRKRTPATTPSVADNIISTALTYAGTRYKYGGTTKRGMDCSGLLYVAFGEHNVQLPRVSRDMAEEGKRVKINKVAKGDLLFFKTKKRGKRINHVGMVVTVDDDEIKFIHASSSRGVIVSSLRDGYWNSAFIKATRVL